MADDTDLGWARQPDWGAFVLQQDFDNPEITFLYCVHTHKKVKLPPLPLGTPEYCLYECEDTHDTFFMIGDDSHWARSHIGHRLVKQTTGEDTETLWMQKYYPDRELKCSRWTCDDWNCQYTPGQMKVKIGNNQKEVLLEYYVWHQPKGLCSACSTAAMVQGRGACRRERFHEVAAHEMGLVEEGAEEIGCEHVVHVEGR